MLSVKLQGVTIMTMYSNFCLCYNWFMFNLDKYESQKDIWESPSLIDDENDSYNYYGTFPLYWYCDDLENLDLD